MNEHAGWRPSMVDLLRGGASAEPGGGGSRGRASAALRSLRWRQRFNGAERYELSLDDSRTLSLRQTRRGELEGLGTGGTVWPAAHVLARYLARRVNRAGCAAGDMRGVSVVEIGAGTGAAGLAAAALGAQPVVLTDQEQVLWLLRENRDANSLEATVAQLDWEPEAVCGPRALSKQHLAPGAHFDLVLVSECVLPQLYPIEPLCDTLDALVGPSTLCLVAYEHRCFPAFDPRDRFRHLAAARGLRVRAVPLSEQDPLYSAEDIEIWEVERETGDATTRRATDAARLVVEAWAGDDCECGVTATGTQARFRLERSGRATERFEILEDRTSGVGAALWPSALVASRFLLAHGGTRPLRVLDLGAGCGLFSVVAAKLGHAVVASDAPRAAALLERNLERTKVLHSRSDAASRAADGEREGAVRTAPHDWSSSLAPELFAGPFDVVACSDCAYDHCAVESLVRTLELLWASATPPAALLVANEQRTALEQLLSRLRKSETLPTLEPHALPESLGKLDCAPPHRQPPPIAFFLSNNHPFAC